MPDSAIDSLPRIATRVALRRLRITDLDDFQAYRTDPDVGRYQGWLPMSAAEATAFISEMNTATFGAVDEWMQLGIVDRATDQLIGDIGTCVLDGDGKYAVIGYSLSADRQGQGLATEAIRAALALLFEQTEADRVDATTDARNDPSVRLLQRIGMTLSRTENVLFRGEPCTEHTYVIRRADWPR